MGADLRSQVALVPVSASEAALLPLVVNRVIKSTDTQVLHLYFIKVFI